MTREPRNQMQRRIEDPVWRAHVLLPLLVLAGLAWIAWAAWDAVVPFAVGLVGAYAVYPLVVRLQRVRIGKRPLSRTLAVLIVYLLGIAALVGFADLVLPPLFRQAGQLILATPQYWENLQVWQQRGLGWYNEAPLPPEVRTAIERRIAELGPSALEWVQTTLLSLVGSTTRFLLTAFGFLVVPLWMFYVLAEAEDLGGELKRLFPFTWRSTVRDLARIADQVLGGYLRGELLLMTSVGVAVGLGALLLGMTVSPSMGRYALLLAVIAGLTEAIPVLGPFLGAVPGVLLALLDGPLAAVWAGSLYLVVQQAENSLLVPRIMGSALRLRAAVIMTVLAVGAALAGPLGAVLAAPLTALLREWVLYIRVRMGGPEPGEDEDGAWNRPDRQRG